MKTIEEIWKESEKFVQEHFGEMRNNDRRITMLSIMKMHIELQAQEIELKQFEAKENSSKELERLFKEHSEKLFPDKSQPMGVTNE